MSSAHAGRDSVLIAPDIPDFEAGYKPVESAAESVEWAGAFVNVGDELVKKEKARGGGPWLF